MQAFKIVASTFLIALVSGCNIALPPVSLPTNVADINAKLAESKPLSQDEAGRGLKEALKKGVTTGTEGLMKPGGFAQNAVYKILLPEEIRNLEQKIRSNALLNAAIGKELDKTIEAMNSGAEKAMNQALPIFSNAISNMSFTDAMKILTGGQGAATQYLKSTTTSQLTQAFQPEIKSALESVAIYNHWTPIVNTVNKNKKLLGLTADVNPNLESYVTEKAMFALFQEIEIQENAIRKDPLNRTSELLQRVFKYADQN
ncbi:MAG: hypothetical protein RLZZ504_1714 [Bacteroidota bacterium]|jgi:Protein of unknown function (DUF4197)